MTCKHRLCAHADIAHMPECFALVRIRQMYLENRNIDGLYGIKDRDRGVGVSCCVQQYGFGPHGLCLLQPINQMPLMIGLTKVDRRAGCPCAVIKMSGNVIKGICAINFGFSGTK